MFTNYPQFKEQCTDITAICTVLDMPRPYIHPLLKDKKYTGNLQISFGEDTFHENIFPITTELITLIDKYMKTTGKIYITNNSLGDDFQPNLIITYEEK